MILAPTTLALAALLATITPTTHHPHHHPGGTMAASHSAPGQGGGKNRTNKGRAGELTPRLAYPIRHPNIPFRGSPSRVGMDANHPIIEATNRPRQLR